MDGSVYFAQTEKKVIAEQEEKDNMVRLRTNLSIPLLPEKEEDKKLAALLTYQAPDCEELTHTLHLHTLFYLTHMSGSITLFRGRKLHRYDIIKWSKSDQLIFRQVFIKMDQDKKRENLCS